MALQSLDIRRRSATAEMTPPPGVRQPEEVAKLIDVTTCIGCKACQVACSEWNDLRDDIGINHGVYDNPIDLTADSWTVMRFTETEENGKLEWLIRKDGCMHCTDPGCLKACPSPGAIILYTFSGARVSCHSLLRLRNNWISSSRVPPGHSMVSSAMDNCSFSFAI